MLTILHFKEIFYRARKHTKFKINYPENVIKLNNSVMQKYFYACLKSILAKNNEKKGSTKLVL